MSGSFVSCAGRILSFRKFIRRLFVVFSGILLARYAESQQVDTVFVDSVVVSVKHGPAGQTSSASVWSWQFKSPELNLNSLGNGQITTISLNGLPARHTAVSINGLNIVPAYLGVVDFSVFPFWLFDDLEVDVNSGVPGALGGSIDFKLPVASRNSIFSEMTLASFGTYRERMFFDVKRRDWAATFRHGNLYSENDYPYVNEYLPGSPVLRMQNASYNVQSDLWHFVWHISPHVQVGLAQIWSAAGRNFPPPISYQGIPRIESQRQITNYSLVSLDYVNGEFKLKFSGGLSGVYDVYGLSYGNSAVLSSVTRYYHANSGVKMQIGRLSLDYVHTYQWYDNNLVSVYSSLVRSQRTFDELGLSYASQVLEGSSRVILLEGKAYMVWFLMLKAGNYRFSLSQNVNFPTLNDLYWQPGGNLSLLPEKESGANVSYSKHFPGVVEQLQISAYYKAVNNWIMWKPSEYHYWVASNAGNVSVKGFSASLGSRTILMSGMAFSCSMSYVLHLVRDSAGNQLPYTPEHKVSFSLKASSRKILVNLQALYNSRRYVIPGSSVNSLPGYFLANLELSTNKIEYGAGEFAFSLKINNFTNTQYYYAPARPQAGINFELKLKMFL